MYPSVSGCFAEAEKRKVPEGRREAAYRYRLTGIIIPVGKVL
jgi:hypothetical protein